MTAPHHPSLSRPPSNLIAGRWVELGSSVAGGPTVPVGLRASSDLIESRNPARPAEVIWSAIPDQAAVDSAIAAAREALPRWARLPAERRHAVLRRVQSICKAREKAMADLIRDEVGKVGWESRGEASILGSKIDITLDASEIGGLHRVRDFDFAISPTRQGQCRWRPHGVMAVIGPFNFPAHLPHGHIVPALAMGNTIVFKPSDKAPGVGQLLCELYAEAIEAELGGGGADPVWKNGGGVINLVQGAAPIAQAITTHPGLDGILFTGSWPVGRRILEANLDRPGRIIALEMGGNNASVVLADADPRQAAIEIIRCAFNTTGQRCTCTRRAIIHAGIADRLIPAMCKMASNLIIGDPRPPSPTYPVFCGPIINDQSRKAVWDFQRAAAGAGAQWDPLESTCRHASLSIL